MCPSFFGGGGKSGTKTLQVAKSPDQHLARQNKIFVSPVDMPSSVSYVKIGDKYFTLGINQNIPPGQVGLTMFQRRFVPASIGQQIKLEPFDPFQVSRSPYIGSLTLELSFFNQSLDTGGVIDAGDFASHFVLFYDRNMFMKGQVFNFEYQGMEVCLEVIQLMSVDINSMDEGDVLMQDDEDEGPTSTKFGILNKKSAVEIYKAPNLKIQIKGSAKTQTRPKALLKKGFKFEDLGIGGLDKEFKQIFRRAFSSRIFPPEVVQKMGIQHVKGLLLHGPPGTGKTLMARQIGKMLNSVEPIVINGPEVLNKYVGESEQNIRKLFHPAEQEYKQKGEASQLHIIIFDELDAICKQRGSKSDGTGVGDSIVNQLLSKMDGVDQLNNLLIIGMTNRIDLIDEALLRPGRLEVQIEISLPDKEGRKQILRVHTSHMQENRLLEPDVEIDELAELTKNYSGAEISGLCKSAVSFAFNKHIKLGTTVSLGKNYSDVTVAKIDFLEALEEIRPAFGTADDDLGKCVLNGIVNFGDHVKKILDKGSALVELVRNSEKTPITSHLLYGASGSGKTALAATIAQSSGYPFIKMITPDRLLNLSESAKISHIVKTFTDAYKSELSIVIIDSIERILDWVSIGPRFSNGVLQTILVYLKKIPDKSHSLHVLATASNRDVLSRMELLSTFDAVSFVPNITSVGQIARVLESVGELEPGQIIEICKSLELSPFINELSIPVRDVILLSHMAHQSEISEQADVFVGKLHEKFGSFPVQSEIDLEL